MIAGQPGTAAVDGGRPSGGAAAWDGRVDRALGRAPRPLRTGVDWLRAPRRRWIRWPTGALLICGGLLSILPVLGLWMLPLGLTLLAEDSAALKGWLERTACRAEAGVAWVRRLRTPSCRGTHRTG